MIKPEVIKTRYEDAVILINQKYQIAEFLTSKGTRIQGSQAIRCPFHDEHTPSCYIDADSNIWHCFGCSEGGGYLSFYRRYIAKYENKNISSYAIVEEMLLHDHALVQQLGFNTIYRTYTEEFTIFDENTNKLFMRPAPKFKYNRQITMKHLLMKAKNFSNDKLTKFIEDCETGMAEGILIQKYYFESEIFNRPKFTEDLKQALESALEIDE